MTRARPWMVYALVALVGTAAFLYPFWFPAEAFPSDAHAADAPLWAALVGGLVVAAVTLEVRRGTMNGATVAILGVLSAASGLLRLVDLPGNNAGIFFLVVLAVYGWVWGFLYGAIMNLWSWPFLQGDGPTQWRPGLSIAQTLHHYWAYYVATSFAWDAAGALFNALLILVTGAALLPSLRRFAHRLEPAVELVDPPTPMRF